MLDVVGVEGRAFKDVYPTNEDFHLNSSTFIFDHLISIEFLRTLQSKSNYGIKRNLLITKVTSQFALILYYLMIFYGRSTKSGVKN